MHVAAANTVLRVSPGKWPQHWRFSRAKSLVTQGRLRTLLSSSLWRGYSYCEHAQMTADPSSVTVHCLRSIELLLTHSHVASALSNMISCMA